MNGMLGESPWSPDRPQCTCANNTRLYSWQKLRQAEVDFEKGTMEASLESLAAQERDLRKKMEEVNNAPASKPSNVTEIKVIPVKSLTGSSGVAKPKVNGAVAKKGKKRKTDGPS